MINSIEEYLRLLGDEMRDADTATRHDALNDAEEYLRSALSDASEARPEVEKTELLHEIIDNYGLPHETAAEYAGRERDRPYVTSDRPDRRFFDVFRDGGTWRALLYCIISMPLGIFYFTWAVTGISLTASLMILIIGLPVGAALFMSFHGLAFIERRIIEGLLGVNITGNRHFSESDSSWPQRIKKLLLGKDSWKIVAYYILMLPLGIIYFTIPVTLLSVSVGLLSAPVVQLILNYPLFYLNNTGWIFSPWMLPFVVLAGFLLLKASLHVIRGIGRMHGGIAKSFLVTTRTG